MAHASAAAHVTSDDLLKAARYLSPPEFERFAAEIITLRACRHAPSLTHDEARLLSRINRGLPPKLQARLDVLIPKRLFETLTESELAELIQLTDKAEKFELQRVKNLTALARLRKTNVRELMKELGIRAPEYA